MAQCFMSEKELVLGSLLEIRLKDTSQKDLELEKKSEIAPIIVKDIAKNAALTVTALRRDGFTLCAVPIWDGHGR